MRLTCLAASLLLAAPAAAQGLRIEGAAPVTLRAGPGYEYGASGEVYPGQVVERGPCDEVGRWCVVSTDATFGWLDTGGLRAPPPPPVALAPPPRITVSPLPPAGARPLPSAVVAAVPPAVRIPAGARPPILLSTVVPLRNVTDGLVNLRAGPGTDAAVVGVLRPGEGGPIDLCDATERWCRIAPPGMAPAWVSTRLVGLRRM